MSCSDQSSELVSSLTLSARITRGQRDMIPSASVLRTPGMCFAVWLQPPLISRRPSILIMSKHARLSLTPPHGEIQDTADVLSPRIRIGSPFASLSSTSSSMTRAATTMPNISNRLIVILLQVLQVSRRSAFLFSSAVRSFCKSYLQNTFLSTQEPPTASKLTSDR